MGVSLKNIHRNSPLQCHSNMSRTSPCASCSTRLLVHIVHHWSQWDDSPTRWKLGRTSAGSESRAPPLKNFDSSGTIINDHDYAFCCLIIDLWIGRTSQRPCPCDLYYRQISNEHHQCWVIVRNLHIEKPSVKSPQTTRPQLHQMVKDPRRPFNQMACVCKHVGL